LEDDHTKPRLEFREFPTLFFSSYRVLALKEESFLITFRRRLTPKKKIRKKEKKEMHQRKLIALKIPPLQ